MGGGADSVLDQGVWSAPVNGIAVGMYLCRIKSTVENAFRFIMSETGHQSGIRHKIEAVNSSKDLYVSKAASATIVDSVITSKPGYYCDTLLWHETIADSVTIALLDTASIRPVASVRTIMPFDTGWLFNKGDASGADKAAFTDASWRSLSVPHDWSIEGPYSSSAVTAAGGGFLPAGIGWYRKHFTLPAAFSERRIFIEFDGVMSNSTVYINGVSLGNRPYGYMTFRYEMTSQVTTGLTENVIAVKVDNSAQPASRWYTGSGINRHVRIIATNAVHIDKWATVVTTPTTSGVHVATTVVNQGSIAQSVAVQAAIFDPSGTALTPVTSAAQSIAAAGSATFAVDVPIANAKLWSPEAPTMYKLVTTVKIGAASVDDELTSFGIRTIAYDPETGFSLNGKSLKHKGVCLHEDMSGLGAAVPQRAMQRRLAILKSLGVNAIRTSHNPVSPDFLDLCDRMGFMVMDEFFDAWKAHKVSGDYATYFTKWYQTDAADIIKRDRNHPSVVIYSIGNEIRDALATRSPIAKDLVSICHGSDPTRPVTQALFRPTDNNDYPGATLDILDVFGANYRNTEVLTAVTGTTPHHAGISTEQSPNTGEWSSFYMAHPQIVGEYLWSGADYLGEAGTWPTIGASSGIIDRVGTIKTIGYSYQSIWSDTKTARPATTASGASKVVLTVDHSSITIDLNDVAYVKATITSASGVMVSSASDAVTFSVSGSAGKILAVDSGNDTQESFTGNVRNAYEGVCYAIIRMTAPGSITVTASASGLTGSSVTVTGVAGSFVPCSGSCD